LDFRSVDEVIADLDALRAKGYRKAGNWSLGQACQHLAMMVRGSLDGFPGPRLPWVLRLVGPFFVRRFIRQRRMPEGLRIPARYRPAADADDALQTQDLQELLRRFKSHTGPLHPSPVAGDLGYDTWRELHLVHCGHHLSFLHPLDGAAPQA
jgi:hypothetical protein